ncbi:MAG TPA: hypothetical protein VGM07_17135 [Stellaceae bacterium]|jgi:hypothetical protein
MTITQDDINTYGPELIRDMQRFAQPEVDRVGQQVNQLQNDLRMTQIALNRQRSMAILDQDQEIGATWRSTNATEDFVTWTREIDSLSNQPRIQLLNAAFDVGAGHQVGNFFKAYAMAKRVPAGQRTSDTLPGERQAGSVRPTARGERRVFTRDEVSRFYRDIRQGVFHGREPERLRLEQEIVTAAREGRVEVGHLRMADDDRRIG